jgi:hypothetical protein
MFSKKGFITVCLLILIALLITGCLPTIPVAVTGVTLDQVTMTLTAGGATGTLVATVAPATASNKNVNWSSSAPAVATVVNGVVTPLTVGTTTITVTTVDGGLTATCTVTVTSASVVTIAAIPGVTPPVTGATPVTKITATAQYTGTVTWTPVHIPFQVAIAYTATITLTPKAGYTLTGVAANFFTVAGATSDTNPANSGVVTAVFPATGAAVINIAAIPGVTPPVTGATPVTTITATAQYTGTVTWSPVAATFASGTAYTATITLTPKAGYTLTGVVANFFKVAGATSDTNPANSGVVTAVFPATGAPVAVTIAAIPGVTPPVTGATPVTTITATAQYTGTVTWSPVAATFASGTVYTAWITINPKAGYTLTGVAANFFTVAGATSDTNPANSGVVTAVFPATGATIATAAIVGVTPPVTGATPVATIADTTEYTAAIAWSPVAATFASGTVYTAWITITPKAGYTLTGVAANFFTVAGATSVTNPANSGVVTAVFPATS